MRFLFLFLFSVLILCELTVVVRYGTEAHSTVTTSTRPRMFARPAREEHSRSWVGCQEARTTPEGPPRALAWEQKPFWLSGQGTWE